MVGSVNRSYQAERDRLGDQAKASRAALDQCFQEWVSGQLSRHRAWGYIWFVGRSAPFHTALHSGTTLKYSSASTDPHVDPPAQR
jgi:hypothetical protein